MPEGTLNDVLQGDQKKEEKLVKLMPTLFIGVGGSGMEVLLRVRRRILNASWGQGIPQRIVSMAEFPVAQFIHFDLDLGAVKEDGRSQRLDPLAEAVALSDEDRICETFDINNYCSSDNDLDRYPLIKDWSPLTPSRIRDLGIDPAKGAGQIRAISRLYFFDKYRVVRDRIRTKLLALKNALSNRDLFDRLGLKPGSEKLRIVVVGSIAGGTGSGSFIDIGLLAKSVATQDAGATDNHLLLLLPTGYSGANKQRTEANGYAALMELETCMRGGFRFVERWDEHDPRRLNDRPYDEVYLVDSGNVAGQHTGDQKDVYEMVADALFEDFGSADYASRKRSIAVNQAQHKISPFEPRVPQGRFGDMKISFYKGYSAFGQAMIDTQIALRHDLQAHLWMGEMLKAFFGVAATEAHSNRATDKQRDEFLAAHFRLAPNAFSDIPAFSAKSVDLRLTTGEFVDYTLTDELLSDRNGSLVAGVQQRVDAALETVVQQFAKDEWQAQVRNEVKQLARDVLRDQDAGADVTEDRVKRRRQELFQEITRATESKLYEYLDNREYGGLEYVLALVEQIKDRLENPGTGLIQSCELNKRRYDEIRDALRTHEYERLLANLGETRGFSIFGGSKSQAEKIMGQLKTEIGNYLKFHLRATAAEQAGILLKELSGWLGRKEGVDAAGNPIWSGLVGALQTGRNAVLEMLGGIETTVGQMRDDSRRDHATYLFLEVPEVTPPLPTSERLAEWANEVFENFGGSRRLFAMLTDEVEKVKLFRALRAQAEKKLPRMSALDTEDPLVTALVALGPGGRQRKFSELMTRAMPWVHANLGGEFKLDGDQYKCVIGVGKAADYQGFREELVAQLAQGAGISRNQVQLVDTGIPGRMVCYIEMSGIPLTILRGLETWRTSYRIEAEKIPVHTHRDLTRFVHPLSSTTEQLERLADDFQIYLKAVALGVLFRNPRRDVSPPGQYKFAVAPGDERNVGNERACRMDGLPALYRAAIIDAVEEIVATLAPQQLAALSALFRFYERQVYQPRLVANDKGVEAPRQGFASTMAAQLAAEFSEKAARKSGEHSEINRAIDSAYRALARWTIEVEGSDGDAYPWEIQPPGDESGPRFKRVAKPEFLAEGWSLSGVSGVSALSASPVPIATGVAPFPGMPPAPPPPQDHQYHIFVNSQQYGPYSSQLVIDWLATGKLTRDTLAWRNGMAQWQSLGTIAELQTGVGTPPPVAAPPPIETVPPVPGDPPGV